MMKANIHICESCNYNCKHCFAKFNNHKLLRFDDWVKIIDNLANSGMIDAINIAGGEPFTHPDMIDIARYIKDKGLTLSIITNGSLMSDVWIKDNAKLFDMIGFSVDSVDEYVSLDLGRHDNRDRVLSAGVIKDKVNNLRHYNPSIVIKINTVVSALNYKDDMQWEIEDIHPNRWKILKMQEFKNDTYSNSDIVVSDADYICYVQRIINYHGFAYDPNEVKYVVDDKYSIIVESSLKGDYIMIDANGCLVDNTFGTDYTRIIDCRVDDFKEGFARLTFDAEMYNKRY